MAVGDGLRVLRGQFRVDVRGVGHGGRRGGGEVAHELGVLVNHGDAEERAVVALRAWGVAERAVNGGPVL